MKSFTALIFIFLSCAVYLNKADLSNDDTDMKLVFVIFRHGERVPETNEEFPTDPYPIDYFYPMTYGEITKEGKRRQYTLGKKLRKRYNEFLGRRFSMDKVITFSTDWERTKMSALLLLAGLFPPDPSQAWDSEIKWLPIPYNYLTSDKDHLIQRPDPYCPRYVEELNRVLQSDEVRNITSKYKKVFDYVTENSGRDMFDFHEMFRMFQNLHAKKFLNLSVPEWAGRVYPEPLQTIASYQCLFENFNPLLRRLNGGHMLQKFIEISKRKMSNLLVPKRRKMFLISGHENNIVNMLAVLGLYQQHIPPYCSSVMLELHQRRSSNEYGFKVFYENDTYAEESHLMRIPGCSEFCPFDQFITLTKPLVPENYTVECESSINLDDYNM